MAPRQTILRGRNIVCFSTADWDTLLPTNKHQLMRRLAAAGNRVLFIETLGTRAPRMGSGTDLLRIRRRLERSLRGPRRREQTLWTLSPLVRPAWRNPRDRFVNRLAFRFQTRKVRSRFPKPILWAYSPYAIHLLDLFNPALVVYHLVDDLAAVPGADREAIREAESQLLARAELVFCTESSLYDRVKDRTRRALFMPNVADYEHFSRTDGKQSPLAARLDGETRPIVLFSGNLAHHKVDFPLLARAARARPQWLFVVAGPLWEGTRPEDLRGLDQLPNVWMTGHVPYEELPSLLQRAGALLIPYLLNEATTAVFPLKFFEYLSTGRPVVSTPLPSLKPYEGLVSLANDAPALVTAIDEALADTPERRANRQALARRHTWERRLEEMSREVEKALGGRS